MKIFNFHKEDAPAKKKALDKKAEIEAGYKLVRKALDDDFITDSIPLSEVAVEAVNRMDENMLVEAVTKMLRETGMDTDLDFMVEDYSLIIKGMTEEDYEIFKKITTEDLDDVFAIKGEDVNEEESNIVYLYPELTEEDIAELDNFGLHYVDALEGEDGELVNAILGARSAHEEFAEDYLGYVLNEDYFMEEEELNAIIGTEDNNYKVLKDPKTNELLVHNGHALVDIDIDHYQEADTEVDFINSLLYSEVIFKNDAEGRESFNDLVAKGEEEKLVQGRDFEVAEMTGNEIYTMYKNRIAEVKKGEDMAPVIVKKKPKAKDEKDESTLKAELKDIDKKLKEALAAGDQKAYVKFSNERNDVVRQILKINKAKKAEDMKKAKDAASKVYVFRNNEFGAEYGGKVRELMTVPDEDHNHTYEPLVEAVENFSNIDSPAELLKEGAANNWFVTDRQTAEKIVQDMIDMNYDGEGNLDSPVSVDEITIEDLFEELKIKKAKDAAGEPPLGTKYIIEATNKSTKEKFFIGKNIPMGYDSAKTEAEAQVFSGKDFSIIEKTFGDRFKLKAVIVDKKAEDEKKCVICNGKIDGHGHNAEPVKKGQACDKCNEKKVLPARMKAEDATVEYEVGKYNKEWGVFAKRSRAWVAFGTKEKMTERAKRLNELEKQQRDSITEDALAKAEDAYRKTKKGSEERKKAGDAWRSLAQQASEAKKK